MSIDYMLILGKELEFRRWLFELSAKAQKELSMTHCQIGYVLLDRAILELSLSKQDLEKSDT